jgi:hypothetical protein
VSLGRWPVLGHGSSATCPPGSLNEETILVISGVGQTASRSIGTGPHAQTVAGVGVDAEPRDRDFAPAERGVAGLGLVVVGALG